MHTPTVVHLRQLLRDRAGHLLAAGNDVMSELQALEEALSGPNSGA